MNERQRKKNHNNAAEGEYLVIPSNLHVSSFRCDSISIDPLGDELFSHRLSKTTTKTIIMVMSG